MSDQTCASGELAVLRNLYTARRAVNTAIRELPAVRTAPVMPHPSVGEFLQHACMRSCGPEVPTDSLHAAYLTWCARNHHRARRRYPFNYLVRQHGFAMLPVETGGHAWVGIRVRDRHLWDTPVTLRERFEELARRLRGLLRRMRGAR